LEGIGHTQTYQRWIELATALL